MRICQKSFLLFFVFSGYFLLAQSQPGKDNFDLLLLEVELLKTYNNPSLETAALIDSAKNYAATGDYEFANIFLEEAKNAMPMIDNPEKTENLKNGTVDDFVFNFKTGIDYNRQEFELGFDQSDSVLLDELSKPFVGFDASYMINKETFVLDDQLRYDKENFQNEIYLKNDLELGSIKFNFNIGNILNRNFEYRQLGFSEFYSEFNLRSATNISECYWNIKNLSRLKRFEEPSTTIPDFFRNTTSVFTTYGLDFYRSFQADYTFDYNESLHSTNNDFIDHDAGLAYKGIISQQLRYNLFARFRYSDFNYILNDELSDSSFSNISRTFEINPEIKYSLSDAFDLNVNLQNHFKNYSIKSEQEPDYAFLQLNPFLNFNIDYLTTISIGYVYEKKVHKIFENLQEQYIKDQDYYSNGFNFGLDYSNISGFILSLNFEYLLRRYPNYSTTDDFNIYSNRNILNILLYSQIPVSERLVINVVGSYDNDKDIDTDFNDMVSSFYTLEFQYSF